MGLYDRYDRQPRFFSHLFNVLANYSLCSAGASLSIGHRITLVGSRITLVGQRITLLRNRSLVLLLLIEHRVDPCKQFLRHSV